MTERADLTTSSSPLRVLVAPSGFKESLSAPAVAASIEAGIHRADPKIEVRRLPLVDGGEGFTEGIVAAAGGTIETHRATGPLGESLRAPLGWLDDRRTAVLEMAAVAGLRLVPPGHRQPGRTTTRGVGDLLIRALDGGCTRILVGCGDSGTNDGGAGMAAALGVRLLGRGGWELPHGGDALADLVRIDATGLDPRLAGVEVEVACNIENRLCGERGVARVYGPQKGATPEDVVRLDRALTRYAAIVERDIGVTVADRPGAGASGGLGAGLIAFCGARLVSRQEILGRWFDIDSALRGVDLVITAEGAVDDQTPRGKIPAAVAGAAAPLGIPVIALAGTLGHGARRNLEGLTPISALQGILRAPCSLPEAIERADEWLTDAAEQAVRLILTGQSLRQVTSR